MERSASGASGAVDGADRGQRAIWVLLLGVGFWLTHFRFPNPPAIPSLDTSWEQAIAHALVRGLQWGSDIEFTFGPLGAFGRPRYDPELYWTALVVWELAVKAVIAAFAALAVLKVRGPISRALAYSGLLVLLAGPDPYSFFAILAVTARLLDSPRVRLVTSALGLAVLAAIALVKFTYFVLVLAAVPAVALAAWRRSTAGAIGVVAAFLVLLSAAWISCGQSLANLPAYVRSSLTIAGGYGEAMSLHGPRSEVQLGLAVAAIGSATALLYALERPRLVERLALSAVLVAGLFIAGKAGFVRHHRSNPGILFAFGATAPLLLLSAHGADRILGALRAGGVWTCAVLGTYGYLATDGGVRDPRRLVVDWGERIAANLRALSDLRGLEAELAGQREALRAEFDLPRIRAEVGDAPVDLIHSRQDLLLLNGLCWRPRPAFQGYYTYAPELLEDNARFLEGPRAPRYIVLAHETIDFRLPNMDDCEALIVMMRDYEPVMVERNCLLLERREDAPLPELVRTVALERDVAWGEPVAIAPLEGGPRLLRLDIRHTVRGRLMTALLESPSVWIEATLTTGERSRFRIVPAMMRSGVLIAPDLSTQDDWIGWFSNRARGGFQDFRVVAGEGGQGWFEPTVRVELVRLEGLPLQVPRRHWGRRRRRAGAPRVAARAA